MHRIGRLAIGLLLALTCSADAEGLLRLEGTARQGGLVQGQVPPGSTVRLGDRMVRTDDEGRFVIGFDRDAPASEVLRVRAADGREEMMALAVAPRSYDVQRIDGLPPAKVTPRTEAELARIVREAALIAAVKRRDSDRAGFRSIPTWPVTGRISGVFGSQRILNGEPRAPHKGLDIAAPRGTAVGAMTDGVVALASPDLYFTGGTVFLDHGHGITSVYAHLDRVDVEEGDIVARGERIGLVGATGRATGPHLHWGVYWFDRAIDPLPLVEREAHPAGTGTAG